MENPVKIFSSENPILSGTSPTSTTSPNATSSDEIAAKLRDEYVATGDTSQLPKKTRKPRSDIGKTRGPKILAGDAPSTQDSSSAGARPDVGFTLDKVIVEKTALTVVHSIDGKVVRRVGRTCFALSKDEGLSSEMARDAGLTKEESGLMAELTGVIFEKRGWLTGYAPEILLGILLTEWGVRVGLIFKRLDAMLKDKKEKEKHKNVDSSSTIENAGNG